jgi:WD40 repeat protein
MVWLFIHINQQSDMLVTSCAWAQTREIKVWQCGANREGQYEVSLFRSFDVNTYLDVAGVGNAGLVGCMECTPNFDGSKLILAIQLSCIIDEIPQQRGFVFTIDVDSGLGTEFMRQQLVLASIDALTGSPADNKFAVIFGKWIYVWDIDSGPGKPLHKFPDSYTTFSAVGPSRPFALNTADNFLLRGVHDNIIFCNLEDGSEFSRVSLDGVRAMETVRTISVSLHMQRIAAVTRSLIAIFDLQSSTQLLTWGINRPEYATDIWCCFVQFCPGSLDLLPSHPVTRSVFIWNSVTGEVKREINDLLGMKAPSVRWWEVGRLMFADGEGNMKIFDINTGEELCCWRAHDTPAKPVGVLSQLNILL